MPRLSKIGAAALAAFGWTAGASVTASYLVVAGGGGGGAAYGGGGGAGGYRAGTTSLNPTLSYTVTVGAGGVGAIDIPSTTGTNGGDSVFGSITSTGGGYGGNRANNPGANGGSGGGGNGGYSSANGLGNTPATSPSQGNNGGTAVSQTNYHGGGGGGASAAGGAGTTVCGAGGAGTANSISGSSVTYAGGGGGGGDSNGGAGGAGGGGAGTGTDGNGTSGTVNLGGGGGGGGSGDVGGNGGSGIVIISYVGAQQFGGGVVTSVGGNTIHTFTTSGTLSPLSSLTASYLVVAGGGGGGYFIGGGGGAGGLLSGSGLTIDTNSTYAVTVGAGGAGGTSTTKGGTGNNSSIFSVTSSGGGGGGSYITPPGEVGANGGSGGGGAGYPGGAAGGTGTAGQGNNGGAGTYPSMNLHRSGGGGGASAAGQSGSGVAGNGGAGSASSISGSSVTYAGGGGGGYYGTSGANGSGGAGGGGAGGNPPTAGTANLGGGGGGAGGSGGGGNGASGGSGVVIISYSGAPQFGGGTITSSGGNTIHTFTSSGYLSPIVNLNNSLRFRSSASAYLNRTGTNTTAKTWTFSAWVKRGKLSSGYPTMMSGYNVDENYATQLFFGTDDTLQLYNVIGGTLGNGGYAVTSARFRDPSAWYHVVYSIDTTQSSAANAFKIYVNGVQQTLGSSGYGGGTNQNTYINYTQRIGLNATPNTDYFDGYMAEINFIDGQALTPSSFGAFNGLGVWQPVRYGGSYGTNGFYLPFTNTTSTTTLGYDFSPNGNNWTTNNISLTAGVTYDSMTDVPTNTSATVANYCVMNPLWKGSSVTLAAANLDASATSLASNQAAISTMFVSSGKWYFEYTQNTDTNSNLCVGIADQSFNATNNYVGGTATTYGYVAKSNLKFNNSSFSSYGSGSSANGDVLMCAFDLDNGKIYFGKNGTWYGSGDPVAGTNAAFTGISGTYCPAYSHNAGSSQSTSASFNFGQRPFAYTPPSGFVALNTFNLPTPTIGATPATTANKYFDATLWTGNSSTQVVTNSGSMQPDFLWMKARNTAYNNGLQDAVRGAGNTLYSNLTNAADTQSSISSFNSNGFTLANDSFNQSTITYVGWQWKANGSGSTNTAGSITSTVSANTTAGFSIVTWSGNSTIGATVGHGLGVAPSMIIVKQRTGVESWPVYHISTGATKYTDLNGTAATATSISRWNNTAPSSSVITLYNDAATNGSGSTYVAYCFAQIAGYSAFGSYTGNSSTDGPFVFTGFRPKYVLIKAATRIADWVVADTSRSTYNVATAALYPNSSAVEDTGITVDILSNGFKPRAVLSNCNASGETYIYMAFAESPFKYANAR